MRILTLLEIVGFGAIAFACGLFGHQLAGVEAGVGAGLLVGGTATVYLVNAYALGVSASPEADDAERS